MNKTLTLTLTADEMNQFADLIAEHAMQVEDDGNEGCPSGNLLWKIQKQVRKAAQ